MNFNCYFVRLSKSLWENCPEDRSFADLAEDARTMENLIEKRIDIRVKQANYIRICEHLQSLAMQYLQTQDYSYLCLDEDDTNNYLSMRLEKTHGILGKCFFRPGDEVENQLKLFNRFKDLKKVDKKLHLVIDKIYNFYHKAYQENNAVIEIITFK